MNTQRPERTYTKQTRKRLQELREAAWERELRRELLLLYDSFVEWKEGRLDAWEISDRIHKFHDGAARELFKTYAHSAFSGIEFPLAYALRTGILTLDEMPGEARDRLGRLAHFGEDEET